MSIRNLRHFFTAKHVVTVGTASRPAHFQMLENLAHTATSLRQWPRVPEEVGASVDLAVVYDGSCLDAVGLDRLLAAGCRGMIWAQSSPVPLELLHQAREKLLRVLGPRSVGLMTPGGLNASALTVSEGEGGQVALIAQSGSVAAAMMDWAAGRHIGFSWAVTTGAEADADIGDFLDVAALDPRTRAVVVQLSALHGARKFMSAARACARGKPVVILQSRLGDDDGHVGADPVRSAAFERAGLVEVRTMDEMFDALAAVDRLPSSRELQVHVVGNGAGVCALGVDAIRRYGLKGAEAPSAERVARILARIPFARFFPGGVDTGPITPGQQVDLLHELLDEQPDDCVLLLHSPYVGQAHAPFAEAVVAGGFGRRIVTVWLGLESTGEARRLCATHGVPTFISAGQAARALRYRLQHRRTQELLMQTPPQRPRRPFERAKAETLVREALAKGWSQLRAEPARQLLAAYGLERIADPYAASTPGLRIELTLDRHTEMGCHFSATAQAPGLRTATAFAFPPLDELLAVRVAERLGLTLDDAARARLAQSALPLSQLALDLPQVRHLRMQAALGTDGSLSMLPGAIVELDPDPPPPRRRLVLAPYPSELTRELELKEGTHLLARPIRPEDEPKLIEFLQSLDPEQIRLRFFHVIRHFTHEMAARMSQIDYDREIAFVAVDDSGGSSRIIGTSHLVADADGREGEYSILVRRNMTGKGLGRHLMQLLLDYAANHGIGTVYGEVLAENAEMLGLAAKLGFRRRLMPDDPGCVRVEWHPSTDAQPEAFVRPGEKPNGA